MFISLFGKRQRERHSSYLSSPSWQGPAHMSELTERLSRWDLHPEKTVTHRFILEEAAEAYPRCEGGAIRESDNCFCVAVGRCCRNAANIGRRGIPSGSLREWVRYAIMERFFYSQRKSDFSAARVAEAETNHKARRSTPRPHHRNAHRNN